MKLTATLARRMALLVACALFCTLAFNAILGAAFQSAAPTQQVPPLDADITPLTAKNIAGHRLWMILFDRNAMQTDDVTRSVDEAETWLHGKTPNVDVVSVAVIGPTGVQVLQDFTTADAKLETALSTFSRMPVDAGATRAATAGELDALTNDVRLTGLKTICDALQPWSNKKEMLYFTTGLARDGIDDSSVYRDAIGACERAHVTIDTIDARGLVAGGRGVAAGRSGGRSGGNRGATGRSASGDPRNVTPLQDLPKASRPDFSGDWQLINASNALATSSMALWLGRGFSIAQTSSKTGPTALTITGDGGTWTFTIDGVRTANHTLLSGDWMSAASWTADTLVLTMSGVASKDGRLSPVVTKHALDLIEAEGVLKGQLRVTTTSTPSGILPDGTAFYRRR